MTKPKIEDFIPAGWYAAMDSDGGVLVSKDRCIRRQYFFYSEGFKYTRFAPEHAAMFDLSIFGPDWEKSLWQKPPEINRCCYCKEKPRLSGSEEYYWCPGCGLVGPRGDYDGSKWNSLKC